VSAPLPAGLQPHQRERRSRGVGSSDAAAVIGLNPYYSAVEVWLEKLGELPPFEGNQATKWGKLLEPAVRQEYAEQTARVVRLPPETLVHPKFPWALCHPDGITDDARLYEGKTSRHSDGWGEPGTDEVPEHYLIQTQHAMMVTGLLVADLAVLIAGQDFRIYTIEADPELHAAMLEAESEFWQHVLHRTRPQLDLRSPGAINVLKKLYPGSNGQTIDATEAMLRYRAELEEAQKLGKAAEANKHAAKAALLDFMGEAALLRFPDGRALRRQKIERKGYSVEPTSFIDARFINIKG